MFLVARRRTVPLADQKPFQQCISVEDWHPFAAPCPDECKVWLSDKLF